MTPDYDPRLFSRHSLTTTTLNKTADESTEEWTFLTYWSVSVLLCLVSCVALILLVPLLAQLYNTHGSLRSITPFCLVLFGDILFICGYLPHHIFNVTQLIEDEFYAIQSGTFCSASSFLAMSGASIQFCGVALAAAQPLYIVHKSQRLSRTTHIPARYVIAVGFVALAFSFTFSAINFHKGLLGPYRGLYCTFNTYRKPQTGGYLLSFALASTLSFVFFLLAIWKTQKTLRRSSNTTRSITRAELVDGLVLLLWKVAGIFVITWGPLALSAFIVVLGGSVPLWFDVIAGWSAKTKPLCDVLVLRSFALLQNTPNLSRETTLSLRSLFVRDSTMNSVCITNVVVRNVALATWIDSNKLDRRKADEGVMMADTTTDGKNITSQFHTTTFPESTASATSAPHQHTQDDDLDDDEAIPIGTIGTRRFSRTSSPIARRMTPTLMLTIAPRLSKRFTPEPLSTQGGNEDEGTSFS